MNVFDQYEDVIAYDFEYQIAGGRHEDPERGRDNGGRPLPLCLTTRSLKTEEARQYWRDELLRMRRPPFDISGRTLAVNFFASAEASCFRVLGWQQPHRLVDLHAEYRRYRNGHPAAKAPGLLQALDHFRLPHSGLAEKDANREIILTTSQWTESLKRDTLRYCQSDTDKTAQLFCKMAPLLDMPHALLRGRYSNSCGIVEYNGVPLDTMWWERFDRVRVPLLLRLVEAVDQHKIFDGLSFRQKRFARFLVEQRIPWERTHEGGRQLLLQDDYFRDQAMQYPILEPIRLLRNTIRKLGEAKLSIGPDGRNRVLLGPFGTVTARNAFSTNKCIFGPDRWTRFTILPPEGRALAYIDWSAQEIGIAAFLSGDEQLIKTYLSSDPYLHFAKLAGLLPEDAVRNGSDEIERLRDKVKILFLGTNYGMSLRGLTWRLNGDVRLAQFMWRQHREHYKTFWRWVQRSLDNADMRSRDWTMLGWQIHVIDDVLKPDWATKMSTLQNWPVQSHGSMMMQLAQIALVEAGVRVAMPLHDAFLVEGPEQDIAAIADFTRITMERAGEAMFGVPFRAKVHTFAERRFEDDRPEARKMWARVNRLLLESEAEQGSFAELHPVVAQSHVQ